MAFTTFSLLKWNVTYQLPNIQDTDVFNSSNQTLTNTSVLPDCVMIQFEEFIPWNNPNNIVSFKVEDTVRKLKELLFLPITFVIGCPANVINMAVFYKQGLKERINVCLFALSLADELHLLNNMVYFGEQLHLHFTTKETYGPISRTMTNNNMIGLIGFIWVSQIMSAIIASDRCFCIMRPLRSQTILSTSTMTAIIVGVYIVTVGLFFLVATKYRLVCAYDPITDSKLVTFVPGEFYLQHESLINLLDGFLFGGILPILIMLVVITTTIITAVKLQQAAQWRARTSSSRGLSQSEVALTKMLVANSIFFIACVFPFGVFRFISFFFPEMRTGGRQQNFYVMFCWLMISVSYVNSTFNIVFYYTMGSRYRKSFWELFEKSYKVLKSIL